MLVSHLFTQLCEKGQRAALSKGSFVGFSGGYRLGHNGTRPSHILEGCLVFINGAFLKGNYQIKNPLSTSISGCRREGMSVICATEWKMISKETKVKVKVKQLYCHYTNVQRNCRCWLYIHCTCRWILNALNVLIKFLMLSRQSSPQFTQILTCTQPHPHVHTHTLHHLRQQ